VPGQEGVPLGNGNSGGAHRLHHLRRGYEVSGDEVVVGMADAPHRHLDQRFACVRRVELDVLDLEVLADAAQYRALALHSGLAPGPGTVSSWFRVARAGSSG